MTLIASTVGTITGFGTSTIMVPVLLFFMPVHEAILLAAIVHWFQNIWRLILFKQGFQAKIILDFAIAGAIAAYLGAKVTLVLPSDLVVKVIAFFLIAYVVFLWFNPHFKFIYKRYLAVLGGASSGFIAGMFGVGGALRAAMLSAFELPKMTFLHSSAAIALIVDSSRLLTYFGGGINLEKHIFQSLLAFIALAYLGTYIGKEIVNKISQEKFRMIICIFLLLASLRLILL